MNGEQGKEGKKRVLVVKRTSSDFLRFCCLLFWWRWSVSGKGFERRFASLSFFFAVVAARRDRAEHGSSEGSRRGAKGREE